MEKNDLYPTEFCRRGSRMTHHDDGLPFQKYLFLNIQKWRNIFIFDFPFMTHRFIRLNNWYICIDYSVIWIVIVITINTAVNNTNKNTLNFVSTSVVVFWLVGSNAHGGFLSMGHMVLLDWEHLRLFRLISLIKTL